MVLSTQLILLKNLKLNESTGTEITASMLSLYAVRSVHDSRVLRNSSLIDLGKKSGDHSLER
jgi:hypothetical protein